MKEILLSDGSLSKVDDKDFFYLSGFNWYKGNGGYPFTWIKGKNVPMHVLILKLKRVDHKDLDPLNNQRQNLRPATHGQNMCNRKGFSKKGLPKGVYPKGNGFYAQIHAKGQCIYLGYYSTPEEAHKAYCEAAVHYFGEFACFS